MNCEDIKNLMIVGVFGDLSQEERDALDDHLRQCSSCAQSFKKNPSSPISFDVPDDVPLPDWEKSWKAISDRALDRPRAHKLFGIPGKWAVAAASLLTVFAIGFIAGRKFLHRPSEQLLNPAMRASITASPFRRYAESLEPLLIDFLHRGEDERPEEMIDLEKKIIRSMLEETRLLRSLADESRNDVLKGYLDEMEFLLISLANLKPGDRESADLLDRMIRERYIRFKLRELSSVKTMI